jgi:hypothetical protein
MHAYVADARCVRSLFSRMRARPRSSGYSTRAALSAPSHQLIGGDILIEGVPGETSTQIRNRFLAASRNYPRPFAIIWAGRHNLEDKEAGTLLLALAADHRVSLGNAAGAAALPGVSRFAWAQTPPKPKPGTH